MSTVERDLSATPEAIIGEYLRAAMALIDRRELDTHRLCDAFAVVALMADLARISPQRAGDIAERLYAAWVDGVAVTQWLERWSEDRSAGRPVGFHAQEDKP